MVRLAVTSTVHALAFLVLYWLPVMEAVECFVSTEGRMVQFVCAPSQTCCGSQCCPANGPFYAHWYFWLAVCMLLLVVAGFVVSACRHFRKQRKYQEWRERNKPELGADLLLNYHLMRTDTFNPPPYDDIVPTGQYVVASQMGCAPPPYDSHRDGSNNNNGTPSERLHHQPPPPLPPPYNECVTQG